MLQTVEVLSARSELRRHVDIDCEVVADVWDVPIEHRVSDLSSRGMWLECDYPLHVGEEVVVTLTPPSRGEVQQAEPIFAFGRVCRVQIHRRESEPKKAGMAVEFLHINDADRERLAKALVGIPPKLREPRPVQREFVWVDELLTFEPAAGSEKEVSDRLLGLHDSELRPVALSQLLH